MSAIPAALDITAIIRQLPGHYILLTPDNTILDASNSYLAITLKKREEVIGRNILEAYAAINENEWQVLADSFEQVRLHRQPFTMPRIRYDLQRTPEQGSGYEERYWQATNTPILGADGQLLYILRQTQDVTAEHFAELTRQAMQRELEESQLRATFILESLPVMVWTAQPDGRADYFNQRWLQFTGRTLEQEFGQGWQVNIHPEDLEKVSQVWQHADASKEKFQVEYRLRSADGQYRWMLAQGVPRLNAEGHITMWIGSTVDMHEQKQLVAELLLANEEQSALSDLAYQAHQLAQSHRETLYSLFMQAPALIAMVRGAEFVFEFVNPLYQELFPERELVGHPVAEVLPETVEQGFVALLDHVYQTGEPFHGKEMKLQVHRRDTGRVEECYLNFTYQVFREHGQIAGISCFAFDVTELVLARQKLEMLLNTSSAQ
ncbi:PAS domain S-box protein [Hymenobacter sp. BT730]|uniref:PAS domain-containing protein n=1 Tax=Hymenobacter sp. BT730 TaxID=3063332 RepID=UPI0026DF87EC|nr:PAS domain S-box protein [Hymenobacter sp. BT730]